MDEIDVSRMPTVQIAWFFLTPGQRDTLKAIALDTKLNLRHQYFIPHIDVLYDQGLILPDGEGYITTRAGSNVYEAGQIATADIELAFWRKQAAAALAERDAVAAEAERLRAWLQEIITAAPIEKPLWLWSGLNQRDTQLAINAQNAAWWQAAQIAAAALAGEATGSDKEDS